MRRASTVVEIRKPGTDAARFGGTFAIKNAEVSSAMLSEKVRGVINTRAEAVTGCDNSCLMHIGGALHRERTGAASAVHLAEILASEEGGVQS